MPPAWPDAPASYLASQPPVLPFLVHPPQLATGAISLQHDFDEITPCFKLFQGSPLPIG